MQAAPPQPSTTFLESDTPSLEEWTPKASTHRAEEGLSGSADSRLSWLKECLLLSCPQFCILSQEASPSCPSPRAHWAPGLGATEEAERVVSRT